MNFVAKITRYVTSYAKKSTWSYVHVLFLFNFFSFAWPSSSSDTLRAVRRQAKFSPILRTVTLFIPWEFAGMMSLCHLFLCLCPLTVKAQLPLFHNISQIINTFVILYLHLNLIFGIARPGIYHKACVVNGLIEKLVSRQLVLGDLSSRPHFWKRHCSKWEGRKEERKGFWSCCSLGFFCFWKL